MRGGGEGEGSREEGEGGAGNKAHLAPGGESDAELTRCTDLLAVDAPELFHHLEPGREGGGEGGKRRRRAKEGGSEGKEGGREGGE